MKRFQGKTAVITGGASGIGFATAKLLVDEGGKVAVTGRSADAVRAAQLELGPGNLGLVSDSAKLGEIDALAEKIRGTFGQIDLLFVNAGVARFLPFEQVTEALYDETLDINLKGAFFTIQKLAPLIRPGGSIVVNTSVAGSKGAATTSYYAASKAGLRSLARTLATELLPREIRVNAVSPGPVRTPIFGKLGFPAAQVNAVQEQLAASVPMKRMGAPEEIAKAVLFLAVDATFSTGAELDVDGGKGPL